MVTTEEMTIDERYKYLRILSQRYGIASRRERRKLLDEAVAVTGLGRKYVCALLHSAGPIRKRRKKQRGREYGSQVVSAVRVVADALDWICAERLQPTLAKTAQHLASFGELTVTEPLLEQLRTISISTVYRILKHLRQDEPRLPQHRGRAAARGPAALIPMTRLDWDIADPGYFEVDLVHHSGPQTSGDYICTLQLIDIATGWSERVAVYGRSAQEMQGAFEKVVSRCPFPIRELHPDNGSEFLNWPLFDFFGTKVKGVHLSRSRPFHKNDNRFVEQKNYTLVRAYLGHARLDTRAQCATLNAIYDDMWVYYNLFQPVLRQEEKTVERPDDGSLVIHRRRDSAQSPWERLSATQALSETMQARLTELYQRTNPRALKHALRERIDALLATCPSSY
jgi:hypothetical protein